MTRFRIMAGLFFLIALALFLALQFLISPKP